MMNQGSYSSSNGSCSGNNSDFPEEFICPISKTLMIQPVIVSSGHTFDLYSIQNLHYSTPSLPDGSVPDFSTLIPNLALRSAILNFCSANSIPFPTTAAASDRRSIITRRDGYEDEEDRILARLRSARVEEVQQTLESLRETMLDAGAVDVITRMLKGNGMGYDMSDSVMESCVSMLYELSRGGLRFRILAKEAGTLEILRKMEVSGNERMKLKVRKVMEVVMEKWEEVEEDVDWEELIDLGFANGNGSGFSVCSAATLERV